MNNPQQLITENLNIWAAAIKKRGSQGRGSSKKIELHGIKKLRELILELAVRGLLVPQDPNDEPASVLLKKVIEEKSLIATDRKIRKEKNNFESKRLFVSPKTWCWVSIGNIAHVLGGKRVPKGYKLQDEITEHAYIRVTDMKNMSVDIDGLKFIDNDVFEQISKYVINKEDVYVTIAGTIGAAGTIPNELDGMNLTENSAKLVFKGIDRVYLTYLLNSKYVQNQFKEAVNQMAQPKLSLNSIKETSVVLAPEAEQPRIVAKVDELMALCDQLEQQTEDSLSAHQTLVETLLNSLLDAAQTYPGHASGLSDVTALDLKADITRHKNKTNSDPFQQTWQRIWENFDALFTTEHSIEQLKQTILQLAVMGKLVPQDPSDEPASVLLEKITAEKEQLIKDGKIKKQKPLSRVDEDEKPYALPRGWEWCRLSSLAIFENGDRSSKYPNKGDLVDNGIPFFGASDIKSGKLAYSDDLRFISAEKFYTLSNGKLVDRDFVMLLRGTVGKVAQYHSNENHSTGFINAQMLIIRLIESEVDSYLAKFFTSNVFREDIGEKISGAVIRQIPASAIAEIKIPLPPEEERTKIGVRVDELMALCDTLKERIRESQATQLHLADTMAEQAL